MPDLHQTMDVLRSRSLIASINLARLLLAAILGGVIGLERQLRHKPAGLRTNIFICFGAAMFTMLSGELAGAIGGDHTRIAAQIIPGIGFIGAGSILHSRGSVVGLTTAATLFVVASVGMAVGGGLYIAAIFATGLMLIVLALLGKLEARFQMKSQIATYEVTGTSAEGLLTELNQLLDQRRLTMQNVRVAGAPGQARVMFSTTAPREDQEEVTILLHRSSIFSSVTSLGAADQE